MPKRDPMQKRLSIEDKTTIAKRSLTETQATIAKDYDISQPAICKVLSKSEQRDIIKNEMAKLVAAVPDIIGHQLDEIKTSQQLLYNMLHPELVDMNDPLVNSRFNNLEDILTLRKLVQSNERELLKSMGILPTQTTNTYIKQIYNDNRSSVINQDTLRFMGMKYSATIDDDENVEVIEAEIVDEIIDDKDK